MRPGKHAPARRAPHRARLRYTRVVWSPSRDVWIWVGGALVVVALVLVWLWHDRPPENLLPQQYGYGIL